MINISKKDINLKDTIECGQCFRFILEEDNSYTIILNDRIINIKEEKENLIINSNNKEKLEEIIVNYLDLETDYKKINETLIATDKTITKYIDKSIGLKMLKQDPLEMIIAYIISANNSVSSIMKAIESISKKYGEKVTYKNKDYYLFPSVDKLSSVTKEEFRTHKIGFRDKYLVDAIKKIQSGEIDFGKIKGMNTEEALDLLQTIKGVGPKVASCILLFGFHRFDVFPVDTWVKKTIEEDYKEVKLTQKSIIAFTKEKYGKYSAIANQYMFHSSRNKK